MGALERNLLRAKPFTRLDFRLHVLFESSHAIPKDVIEVLCNLECEHRTKGNHQDILNGALTARVTQHTRDLSFSDQERLIAFDR